MSYKRILISYFLEKLVLKLFIVEMNNLRWQKTRNRFHAVFTILLSSNFLIDKYRIGGFIKIISCFGALCVPIVPDSIFTKHVKNGIFCKGYFTVMICSSICPPIPCFRHLDRLLTFLCIRESNQKRYMFFFFISIYFKLLIPVLLSVCNLVAILRYSYKTILPFSSLTKLFLCLGRKSLKNSK